MTYWYPKIEDDYISHLPEFIDYYSIELVSAREEVKLRGKIEKHSSGLPSILEHRFSQLQDIEAILEYLNIELRKVRHKHLKAWTMSYNGGRSLTDRQMEKFAMGEPEVFDLETIVNKVALLRNQYLGILKGLENKSWQISNLCKLRCAGLDDAEI